MEETSKYAKALNFYLSKTSHVYSATNLLQINQWLSDVRAAHKLFLDSPSLEISQLENFRVVFQIEDVDISICSYKGPTKIGEYCYITNPNYVCIGNYVDNYKCGEERTYNVLTGELTKTYVHFGPLKLERFHDRGNTQIERSYANNKRYGKFTENYLNPNEDCIIGTYLKNQFHGTIKTYRKDANKLGKLKKVENFVLGELHGVCLLYHENGKLFTDCEYIFGELYGPIRHYDASGAQTDVEFALFDVMVSQKEWEAFHKENSKHLKQIKRCIG